MLPLIMSALGVLQQNQSNQEDRKKQMEAAAMGQFANTPAPGAGNGAALAGLGKAIGGMMGGPSASPAGPISDKSIGEMSPMAPGVQATGGPVSGEADEELREKLGLGLYA